MYTPGSCSFVGKFFGPCGGGGGGSAAHPGFVDPEFLAVTEITSVLGNDSGHAEAIFLFKNLLKNAGWVVQQSGDGVAYDANGDTILTAAEMDTVLAWFVIEAGNDDNAAGERQQWCVQLIQRDAANQYRVKHSRAAGFTGGAPSATQVPSAADEVVLLGGGTDAAPTGAVWFNNWGNNATTIRAVWGVADSARNSFYFVAVDTTNAIPFHAWALDRVRVPAQGDEYPYAMYVSGNAAAYQDTRMGTTTEGNNDGRGYLHNGIAWILVTLQLSPFGPATVAPGNIPEQSDLTQYPGGVTSNKDGACSIWTRSANYVLIAYPKGQSSIFYWIAQTQGAPHKRLWDNPSPQGNAPDALIAVGANLAMAWNGTVPNPPVSGAWTQTGTIQLWDGPEIQ